MNEVIKDILLSWKENEGNINKNQDILDWIFNLNKNLTVNISNSKLSMSNFWDYDEVEECISNKNNSFFKIKGIYKIKGNKIITQQPIIIQNEIGYLGIICKKINGVLNFLMQAKIEPGNINNIQISPTIQATKSNFTKQHGGNQPPYLEYFTNKDEYEVIVDQIQSEQSSRFYKKRNRNIIIRIDEDIEVLSSHKWMTLGQLKQLMKIDNLVNMDTRTVIAGIPFVFSNFSERELKEIETIFVDKALFKSIFNDSSLKEITDIYKYINNYKMFSEIKSEIVPLNKLNNWNITDEGVKSKKDYNFSVIFCDIEVEGREVRKWTQPLFKAEGLATFGLFTTICKGIRKFLVKCVPEIGAFDGIEIGPTVQLESVEKELDEVSVLFIKYWKEKKGILYDVVLSEEGGRFYHEQNYNIIIEVKESEIKVLPEGYFWIDYKTLNTLIQINNCLNIQLRNLLSLLEV